MAPCLWKKHRKGRKGKVKNSNLGSRRKITVTELHDLMTTNFNLKNIRRGGLMGVTKVAIAQPIEARDRQTNGLEMPPCSRKKIT